MKIAKEGKVGAHTLDKNEYSINTDETKKKRKKSTNECKADASFFFAS